MNKKELQKVYKDIVLKTNGGNDDYVVALLKIGEAIGELDEPQAEECEVKYIGYVSNQGNTYKCDCGYWEVVETHSEFIGEELKDIPYEPPMFRYPYCRNCGRKIKKGD